MDFHGFSVDFDGFSVDFRGFSWIFMGFMDLHGFSIVFTNIKGILTQLLYAEVEDVSAAKELLAEGRRKKQEELANEEKKRCLGGDFSIFSWVRH